MKGFEAQFSSRRKLISAARNVRLGNGLPPAFFLTDPQRTPDPLRTIASLPAGWGVIYRHFGVTDRRETTKEIQKLARRRKLTLLVSADAALFDLDVDGFHWPRSQPFNRSIAQSKSRIHTGSAWNRKQIGLCRQRGLSACLVSSIFPSQSPSAPPAMGIQRFRHLALETQFPIYALGGVTEKTAPALPPQTGFAGVQRIVHSFSTSSDT